MLAEITTGSSSFTIDLDDPIDISIPLRHGEHNPNCFHAPLPEIWPVRAAGFVGMVAEGGAVNFRNVRVNPHGNGTHTECVGHITSEAFTINQCLKSFHFPAKLVSIYPAKTVTGDRVIAKSSIQEALGQTIPPAVIVRTQPNDEWKMRTNYSGANPPYFLAEAIQWLVDQGVQHLLTDLPSVDREEDGGALTAHRAFWQYPEEIRTTATITELIFVPNAIPDGNYLLQLQICSLEMDASPSKPVLYALK